MQSVPTLVPLPSESALGPSYFHLLPVDILTMIAAPVLRDDDQEYTARLTMFAEPVFGALTSSESWRLLLATQPEHVYRTAWSSNNHMAVLCLRYDGTIDYPRLLYQAQALVPDHTAPVVSREAWTQAQANRYDILLTTFRTRIAAQLTAFLVCTATLSEVTTRIDYLFTLPDLFAVAQPDFEQDVWALCRRAPAALVNLSSHFNAGVINYDFWADLYLVHIKPYVGETIRFWQTYKVKHWHQAWFRAAIWANDSTKFRHAYSTLGYCFEEVMRILKGTGHQDYGLTLGELCRADADELIDDLGLWPHVESAYLVNFISEPSRVRAVVQTRTLQLTAADFPLLYIRGLPRDIMPYLPPHSTPAVIADMTRPTPGVVLALINHDHRPWPWTDIYHLCAAPIVKRANLINYLLPLERVRAPAYHDQLPYLGVHWLPPLVVATSARDDLVASNANYMALYRLFLIYFVTHAGPGPRTRFHCYNTDHLVEDHLLVRCEHSGADSTGDLERHLTFCPRPYARILSVDATCAVEVTPSSLTIIRNQGIAHIQIPAAVTLTIRTAGYSDQFELYDYDVTDGTWLQVSFALYYGITEPSRN